MTGLGQQHIIQWRREGMQKIERSGTKENYFYRLNSLQLKKPPGNSG